MHFNHVPTSTETYTPGIFRQIPGLGGVWQVRDAYAATVT